MITRTKLSRSPSDADRKRGTACSADAAWTAWKAAASPTAARSALAAYFGGGLSELRDIAASAEGRVGLPLDRTPGPDGAPEEGAVPETGGGNEGNDPPLSPGWTGGAGAGWEWIDTSCRKWWANQFRLLLSSLAYTLLEAIRRTALRGTALARAHCGTLRLKLLRVGAVVQRNTRRVRLLLSSSYPHPELFLVHPNFALGLSNKPGPPLTFGMVGCRNRRGAVSAVLRWEQRDCIGVRPWTPVHQQCNSSAPTRTPGGVRKSDQVGRPRRVRRR